MDIARFLRRKRGDIIENASDAMRRSHLSHYESVGPAITRVRLESLLECLTESAGPRRAKPIIHYAERIAAERFHSGFELREVQTAFNVLEEAIWREMFEGMEPLEFGKGIALVSAILAMGKDALACTYVSLAAGARVPALDTAALLGGTDATQVSDMH